MKKCILSALVGAAAMFLLLVLIANIQTAKAPHQEEYEHIDYVSNIMEAECYVCGESGDTAASANWGEDNVGIINLNTFELLRLEINHHGDHGQLIEEDAGYMQTNHLSDEDTYVHAYTHSDNGYAHVQITGAQYNIDRESVQSHLCQSCLDTINDLCYSEDAPAEYAIVSFAGRTIRPLMKCTPWFSAGDYGIDCEFRYDGAINLLIHYYPNRHK